MSSNNHRSSRDFTEGAGEALQRFVAKVALEGVGPLQGGAGYAQSKRNRHQGRWNADELAIRQIVSESTAMAGSAGLVTGLGGFVWMPVSLPANIASSLTINARMVASIAHLRGYELEDPYTQSMLMLTVAGSGAQSALANVGVKVGQQAARQAIRNVPLTVLKEINKKAGFYLVAKYGTQRSAITLAKGIPLAGGVVGATVDAALTRSIGLAAKRVFPPAGPEKSLEPLLV